MSLADRLHRLVPDLSAALARFPVPALLSVLLCVYANLDVATLVSNGAISDNQVYLGGAAAFTGGKGVVKNIDQLGSNAIGRWVEY